MVFKKSIYDGGFDGLRAPVIPKAPRSLRRRSLQKQSSESSEICAFELLATVAGKLLQESESSTSSTGLEGKKQISIPQECAKQEKLEVKVKHSRSEYLDQGSCAESEFFPEPTNIELKLEPLLKELQQSDNDSGLEHASIVTSSDFLKKVDTNVKLEASQSKNEVGDTSSKLEGVSPSHGDLCDVSLGSNRTEIQTEAVDKQNGDLAAVKACSYRDPMKSCVNNRVLNKSYSSVHLPFYRDPFPSACFPRHKGNVKIGIRDDDENSLRCIHRGTKTRTVRSQSRARYRRMRKMLTSKYWKAAPKLKDYELTNTTSVGVKPFYHKRKNIYIRESCKTEADNKRRKLFHHSSKPAFFQEGSSESISNSPEMSVTGHKRRQNSTLNRGVKSSIINHKGSFQSKENYVKFSIKSFKVPELYVEVPETATIGSLKRTVMEAVKAILGGELRVGVHLQGKKIRDENKTLQQTGISHNSDLETLGFTLEPSFPQASPSLIQKEPPQLLPCETHQQLSRPGESPIMDVGFPNSSMDPPIRTSLENHVEKIQEIIPFETEVSVEERGADSKAIVPVSAVNAEALSIVPVSNKLTKRSELSQRRTRRPFSVSEVEALVEAVETLGTGRWRDVKMRSFDDANHRTYVDLKDKWKTLVHTASISPQQRRGEPVPQDLLDRVLAAHAHWSQHQSKQHAKHQTEPLLTSANTNVGH